VRSTIVAVLILVVAGLARGQESARPRVFMTPGEVRAARTGTPLSAEQAILRETLLRRAEEALKTPLRYIDPANPDQALAQYRPWPTDRDSEMLLIRKDAADTDALAVAYAITGDRRFADRAWENVRVMLSTYRAFGSFHPHRENNDLAAAHAFMALATTWDLCADVAPEATKRLVLTEGVRRARFMYNTAVIDWRVNGLPVPFETPGVPETKQPYNRNIFAMLTTNHCWVDVALLGCLALSLENEDVAAAGPGSGPKDWLRFATHFFEYNAGIMPSDGSWPESRVYGAPYAFEGSMPFLRVLKKTKGLDLMSRTRFFHNFTYGRLYAVWNHPGHGGIANFGEGSDHEWHSAAWIYAVAAAYRDPVLQWSANCWTRKGPATDETAWQYLACDPTLSEQTPDSAGLPRAIFHGDMSQVHVRGGSDPWGANDRVLSFRGVIAGRYQYELQALGKLPYVETWHMHLSRNAVLLAVNGSPLITRATDFEDGTGLYSVLQVNGRDQSKAVDYEGGAREKSPERTAGPVQALPPGALPGVTDYEATEACVTFSNEIGAAYPDLDLYRRRVVCVEPDLYVIADHARAPRPVRMDFRLHFGAKAAARFLAAENGSPLRVEGSLAGVPYSCEIVSTDSLSAELGEPNGGKATRALRYGPPSQGLECRVAAVIRLNDARGRVLSLRTDRPNRLGVFIEDHSRPLALILLEEGDCGGAGPVVRYSVPRTGAQSRHLLTGLDGSKRYSVRTQPAGAEIAVTVSAGDELNASPQGTLLFDLAPDGAAVPVKASPLPAAQDIAAKIAARPR
jgi:hypothetical protein